MRTLNKAKTLLEYTRAAWTLGDNLRSKLVLVTFLPRLKCGGIGVDTERLYKVYIQINSLRRVLHLRVHDIFLVYEVLWGNPYIYPEMLQNPPQCILDLGAHIGLATIRFKACFPDAAINCYEPDPENYLLLEKNTRGLSKIILHREAVGSEDTNATFYVAIGRHSASSLLCPAKNVTFRKVDCEVRSLDGILERSAMPVDLVKFDIEGIEYDVFSASRHIHEVRWIVGELKGDTEHIERFLNLFPHHYPRVMWITSKMAVVYLQKKA